MTKDPQFFLATTSILLNIILLYTLTGVTFYILFGSIFKDLFGIQFPILGTRNSKMMVIFATLNFAFVSVPELTAGLDAGEAAVTSIDSTFFENTKLLGLGDEGFSYYESFKTVGSYIKTAKLMLEAYPELRTQIIDALYSNTGDVLYALPAVPV